jgi:rhodanese-related sulfurtransferase
MDLPWWLPFGEVPEIDGEELYDRLQEAAAPVVIDVRTPLEFAYGHIEGAVNVPITDLKSRLASLKLRKDHPAVAICLSAHRSIPAVRLFEEAGMKKAYQLQGGMLAWQKAGLPTVKSGESE